MSNSMKATLETIEVMLKNADKGPSGFWVEDHEGCGNPSIFPEFEKGLKSGAYIRREQCACPWDRSILFGDSHAYLGSGCYHRCAIREAKYLNPEMIKRILRSFTKNLKSGKYATTNKEITIEPLIRQEEIRYIEKQKKSESDKAKKDAEREHAARLKKASKLLAKFPAGNEKNEIIRTFIGMYYGTETWANTTRFGMVDFRSDGMKELVGGEDLSYDDYIELQIKSPVSKRRYFIGCFFNIPDEFKGRIEKITEDTILFKRIMVSGMYPDDFSYFDGKEDHVWMSRKGFESFKVGDCVSFYADVYRYIKKSNGKAVDYSLRNPQSVSLIESYKVPTDKQLMEQSVTKIICDTCFLRETCVRSGGSWCMRDKKELNALKKSMIEAMSAE